MHKQDKKTGLWLRNILRDERGFMPGLMPILGAQEPTLPLADLTLHFDFSDNNTLWKTFTSGNTPPYTVQASADADVIEIAHSLVPAQTNDYVLRNAADSDAACPVLRSSTPGLPLQCLDFDGSNDSWSRLYTRAGGTVEVDPFSDGIWGVSDKTLIIAVRVEAFPASGDFGTIVGESSATTRFNIGHINSGGTPQVFFSHFDGSYDQIFINAAINTNYVLVMRHDGVNLYGSVNGGAESSVASGATSGIGSRFGVAFGGTAFFNGRVGEIACWDVALTGANLDQAIAYFMNKWT